MLHLTWQFRQVAMHSPVNHLCWWWASHQTPSYFSGKGSKNFANRKKCVWQTCCCQIPGKCLVWWKHHELLVSNMWRCPLAPEAQKPKLLIADLHKVQKTPAIVDKLKTECKTEVVLVPPGCTSLIQPLDMSFNGEFKTVINGLQTKHMHDHLDQYV